MWKTWKFLTFCRSLAPMSTFAFGCTCSNSALFSLSLTTNKTKPVSAVAKQTQQHLCVNCWSGKRNWLPLINPSTVHTRAYIFAADSFFLNSTISRRIGFWGGRHPFIVTHRWNFRKKFGRGSARNVSRSSTSDTIYRHTWRYTLATSGGIVNSASADSLKRKTTRDTWNATTTSSFKWTRQTACKWKGKVDVEFCIEAKIQPKHCKRTASAWGVYMTRCSTTGSRRARSVSFVLIWFLVRWCYSFVAAFISALFL